jgi:hypothetical protein
MSLDLNKLENKLDEALSNETSETLTKFLNDKRMTNNKQQTAVEQLAETLRFTNKEVYAEIYDDIQQAKEMEAIGKEMSYDDGYREGYKRAYELMEWCMKNYISGKVQDHIVDTNKKVDE